MVGKRVSEMSDQEIRELVGGGATKPDRAATLRAARDGMGSEYAAAIGLIIAVVEYPDAYDDPLAEIRTILAALDEVTNE